MNFPEAHAGPSRPPPEKPKRPQRRRRASPRGLYVIGGPFILGFAGHHIQLGKADKYGI